MKFINWLLVAVLFVLPFQELIEKSVFLSRIVGRQTLSYIYYLDEISIALLFPVAIFMIIKEKRIFNWMHILILFPLVLIGVSGIISGLVNGNSLLVTFLGTFDYIKNFFVIFIFAVFFKDSKVIKWLFRSLLGVAVLSGGIALIQEFWALFARYILGTSIYDRALYILRSAPRDIELNWRFGLYKTISILSDPNVLGLYCLLLLTIYIFKMKKMNFVILILLVGGIFSSVSRVAYAGLLALGISHFFMTGRRLFLFLLVPFIILLFYMSTMWDFNIWEKMNISEISVISELVDDREEPDLQNAISFRDYTRIKSVEIWKDYPYWGVGPGMYGSAVSLKYQSHYYEEYGFIALNYLIKFGSFDQFWPQVLAELGIIGALLFVNLLISVVLLIIAIRKQSDDEEMRGVLAGLIIYTMVILIYTMGSGLNLAPILYTYCAFIGICLGSIGGKEDIDTLQVPGMSS